MTYRIDFHKWIVQMLPYVLRKPVLIALIETAISPLMKLRDNFFEHRDKVETKLTHNGQVCHLRGILEQSFGKGFIIKDKQPTIIRPVYAYREQDNQCLITYQEPSVDIPVTVDANVNQDDTFIVLVPAKIYESKLQEVLELINQYKLPSKSFQCISL